MSLDRIYSRQNERPNYRANFPQEVGQGTTKPQALQKKFTALFHHAA
uniref:Uncharacterized protein n=1 Tax=Anguilla anguilla TaxID=7936 RepID=A0A0E9U4E0_ANGAN